LGCGDGQKASLFIKELAKHMKIRYCPIDISSYMVTKAIDKIKKLEKGEVVEFTWNISDFDNLENVAAILRDGQFRQNFLLFLGSTIGNFEIHEVMYEIAEAMAKEQDYLLIGVALNKAKPEEIIKSYKNTLMSDFLSLILEEIGFTKDDLEFGVRFENSRIEMFYTIKEDKKLQFENRHIYFEKGDQILVAISYRYTKEQLDKIMKIYFNHYKFYVNDDESWALILCRK